MTLTRTLAAAMFSVAAMTFAFGSASAQQKLVLKASDVHPEGYAIAFARVSVGALGPVVDQLNVFNLPYVFRNTEHMRKVIDGQVGQDLLDAVTNSGKGLVGLCWMDAGARNFYDTKKPIHTLADLKGLKFRVMGNPMFVDMANSTTTTRSPSTTRSTST